MQSDRPDKQSCVRVHKRSRRRSLKRVVLKELPFTDKQVTFLNEHISGSDRRERTVPSVLRQVSHSQATGRSRCVTTGRSRMRNLPLDGQSVLFYHYRYYHGQTKAGERVAPKS